MRLLDTLIKKRDHHLALAQKFSDLIAVVQGDEDFAKHTHDRKLAIMDAALAQHVATNGNGNGNGHEAPAKVHASQTPEARKAQARRMRLLWKNKRALMLKASALGRKNGLATRRAKKRARAERAGVEA
jgi:hypothetical protein